MSPSSLKLIRLTVITLVLSMVLSSRLLAQGPGTAFRYQGSLYKGETPVTDTCDFTFKLYDAATGDGQLGETQTVDDVAVRQGRFTAELDFGPGVFTGSQRYLEIAVQCRGDTSRTTLSPRQGLYPTPYALYATQAGSVDWQDVISRPENVAVISQTISGLRCSDGEIARWNAGAGQWLCAGEANPATSYVAGTGITITKGVISSSLTAGPGLILSGETFALSDTYRLPQTCGQGQLAQWDLTTQSWGCTTAASYSAGTGLQVAGQVFSLSAPYRLPQSCAANEIAKWDGLAWVCAADLDTDTDTTYTAGTGITITKGVISSSLTAGPGLILSGETFALSDTYRLPQTCGNGQVAKWDGVAWLCATDANTDTTYAAGTGITITKGVISSSLTAGPGLVLSGETFALSDTYRLPQSCAANEIAKWNGVAWLCATDANTDTTYAAGNDITITNNTISSTVPHPANVVWVAKSGGDFTAIQAALDSITDAAADNRYLVMLAPGVYTEQVTMKPYVDIEGSGELNTRITFHGANSGDDGTIRGANDAELRFLTVENTGGDVYATAIYNSNASPYLTHVTASASGGTEINFGVRNYYSASPTMSYVTASASGGTNSYGVYNYYSASPTMNNVTASASGGTSNFGVRNYESSPTMNNVTASASGGTKSYGVYNNGATVTMNSVTASASGGNTNYGVGNYRSSSTMSHVTASASGGTESYGVYNYYFASLTMTDVTVFASDGNTNYGVYNASYESPATIQNSTLRAVNGTANYGLYSHYTSGGSPTVRVRVSNSQLTGSSATIYNGLGYTTLIGGSLLEGGTITGTGTINCAGVYDENYVFYPDTCP